MTALFMLYMDSPNWSVIDASDGEYLTNLDCELGTNHAESQLILREFTAFEKCGALLMRYFNGELESFSDIPFIA